MKNENRTHLYLLQKTLRGLRTLRGGLCRAEDVDAVAAEACGDEAGVGELGGQAQLALGGGIREAGQCGIVGDAQEGMVLQEVARHGETLPSALLFGLIQRHMAAIFRHQQLAFFGEAAVHVVEQGATGSERDVAEFQAAGVQLVVVVGGFGRVDESLGAAFAGTYADAEGADSGKGDAARFCQALGQTPGKVAERRLHNARA